MKPRVLIPVALGTNRDGDLAAAFAAAGRAGLSTVDDSSTETMKSCPVISWYS